VKCSAGLAGQDLDPGPCLGAVPGIGNDDGMAAFGEESDLAIAFVVEFEGVALPAEILTAFGLEAD